MPPFSARSAPPPSLRCLRSPRSLPPVPRSPAPAMRSPPPRFSRSPPPSALLPPLCLLLPPAPRCLPPVLCSPAPSALLPPRRPRCSRRFLGFFRSRLCALRAGCAHRRLCRRVRRLPDAFHGSLLGFARRFLRDAARQSIQLFRYKVRIGECVALVPFFALLAAKIPNLQFVFSLICFLLSPEAPIERPAPSA